MGQPIVAGFEPGELFQRGFFHHGHDFSLVGADRDAGDEAGWKQQAGHERRLADRGASLALVV